MTSITSSLVVPLDSFPFPVSMHWNGSTATYVADVERSLLESYLLRATQWKTPLDSTGSLATLLAVTGTLTVEDAANAVGLTPDDLVAEAQAWAISQEMNQ